MLATRSFVKTTTSLTVGGRFFFSTKPSIAIIGAGIGGLTAANALLYRGVAERVSIYEQAQVFLPSAGAGFGFSPNGQICLSSIGITTSDLLHPFDTLVRLNKEGTSIRQESNALEQLRERHGFGVAGCLRADLVDLLLASLAKHDTTSVQYSHKLAQITPSQDKVHLEFENGHQDVVDLVVGADGIHSLVATQVEIDDAPPTYSGANIFYGVIPDPDSLQFASPIVSQDHTVVQGPGTGEFITFRVGPNSRKKQIWASTYVADQPPARRDEWDHGESQELQNLLQKYPESHPIHELAEKTPAGGVLHFGLFYRPHKTTWFRDRVVLLGDSCHATLPYVGQGANQAIEDAIVLADCLAANDNYQQAFATYYQRRFNRTKRIVQLANFMSTLYHSQNWFMQQLLDFFLSQVLKGGLVFQQIEKEIVEECPVKDWSKYRPK